MGFRLIQKSVTLNDLAMNGLITVILRYSTEFGSIGQLGYVKVVEDKPILCNVILRIKLLAIYDLWRYSHRLLKTNSLERGSPVKAIL